MTYSQYGEDDFIALILGRDYFLNQSGICVEIGAGDGQHLSNTALFRHRGWKTILVEPDVRFAGALQRLEGPSVEVFLEQATPDNINTLVPPDARLLSIDVDGDDYFLLDALDHAHRPEVIVIEFNPTMPRDVDIAPARLGLQIGASILALKRVAQEKGYGLLEITHCNLIFGHGRFDNFDIDHIERPEYVVCTEYYSGRPLVIGTAPWGVDFANPFPPSDVIIR